MTASFAEAFKEGCREAPQTQAQLNTIDDIISRMCGEVSALIAPAELVCKRAADNGRAIYVMRTNHERGDVAEPIEMFGVEVLSLRSGALGYPCRVEWCNGFTILCNDPAVLEAELANGLRRPAIAQRIRSAAQDVRVRVARADSSG